MPIHILWIICGVILLSTSGLTRNLEPEDAIIVEANFKILDDEAPVEKCNADSNQNQEGRTESTGVETTDVVSDDLAVTTNVPELDFAITTTVPEETEIINQLADEPGSYPWLVEVFKNGKHFCAGSLIDHRHVLLSAYCIYKLTPNELAQTKVDIGFRNNYNSASRDLYEGPAMSQRVKKVIYHRYFNVSTAYNDIGLLQLEHPIMFDKLVQPISIAEDEGLLENSLAGSQESIVGWKTSPESGSVPVRSEEIVKMKSLKECRRNYLTLLPSHGISESMQCAGGETEATTCYWSFGSPLLARSTDTPKGRPIQIGLFSWGIEALLPGCAFSATDQTPMVFTRISSFADWITRNLRH
jgi:secreted trypsin-like serine protease